LAWLAIAARASWANADEEIAYEPPGRTATAPVLSPPGPPIASRGAMSSELNYEDGPIAPVQYVGPAPYVAQEPNPGEPLGFSGAQFAPRPGPAVDPAMTAGVFDAPYIASYFDPADPDAPAPSVSSGEWLRNGRWYTEQSVIYWSRTANVKNDVPLAFEFISLAFPDENALDVRLDLGFEPGLRSTLGRYLGRDAHNRDHSLEFTFLGLTHWQYAKSITAEVPGTIFQLVDPLADVPVFEESDTQAFDQVSDFNSYEFNYRIDRRLGRDRLIYTRDSCWVRQATPALLCSAYAGIRVAIINERIDWTASNTFGNGRYVVVTHNNMVGPQVGADLMYEHTYWRAGIRASAGALVNWASQSSTVRILDTNDDPLVPNRDEFDKDHTLSFVGGLNFIGQYRFRPSFGLRVSYDLLWASDLALAQNQITFFPSNPAEISDSHALFFQGVSLGFEWFR
jgi:hypothetical protein